MQARASIRPISAMKLVRARTRIRLGDPRIRDSVCFRRLGSTDLEGPRVTEVEVD